MTKTANPRLLRVLEGRLDAILDGPDVKGLPPGEAKRVHGRIRSLRLSIARLKGNHTGEEWEALIAETGGICVRCGYQHDLSFERPCKAYILPIVQGGSASIENLMPLCRHCTISRNPVEPDWLADWRQERDRKVAEGA